MNALTFTAAQIAKAMAERVARVAEHQATKFVVVIAGFAGACEAVYYVATANPVASVSAAVAGFVAYGFSA